MYQVDRRRDMFDRRVGKNPMAEIENVSRPPAGAMQNISDPSFDLMHGSE